MTKHSSPSNLLGGPLASGLARRDLLKGLLGAGALALAGRVPRSWAADQPGLIRRENEQAGTRTWMLTRTGVDPGTKYRCPWIEG